MFPQFSTGTQPHEARAARIGGDGACARGERRGRDRREAGGVSRYVATVAGDAVAVLPRCFRGAARRTLVARRVRAVFSPVRAA